MIEFWADLSDWAWARHHNVWSWHVRPLIIIAFCLAAYLRRVWAVVLCALLFPLSAVLFPAPEIPRPEVFALLEQERLFVTRAGPAGLAVFAVAVIGFLWLLALAFWRRSLWLGVLIANLGGALKVGASVAIWGEAGLATVRPAILTAIVFNLAVFAAWLAWRTWRARQGRRRSEASRLL